MEDKIAQGTLYDFYGELLNVHQRRIYEAFVYDDLSLGEIAEQEGISRQGVHDVIRRCTGSMEEYESRLHLVEKFGHVRAYVSRINELTRMNDSCDRASVLSEIRGISEKILEEL